MEKQTYKEELKSSPQRIRYSLEISGLLNAVLTIVVIFLMINPISSQDPFDDPKLNVQPNSINATELFTKVLNFETDAEKQDFLKDYNDGPLHGRGTVAEIGNLNDEKFVIEINIMKGLHPLVCSQEKTEENKKQFPFLKGKNVNFSGTLSTGGYFGYEGFVIDNCVIQRQN